MNKNNSPATKKDVRNLKNDVKKVQDDVSAVRKDLIKVKDELSKKIVGGDKKLDAKIDGVEKRLDAKIDGVEKSLEAKIEITAQETRQDFKQEMSKNTSKILNTFDKFLKEILDSRQERILVSEKLSDHEDRIERVEKHVFAS